MSRKFKFYFTQTHVICDNYNFEDSKETTNLGIVILVLMVNPQKEPEAWIYQYLALS